MPKPNKTTDSGNGAGNTTTENGLKGTRGDDIFVIHDSAELIQENRNGGTDTVLAFANYVLPDWVEHLELQGVAPLSGWGNELDNALTGNAGDNALYGLAGDDTLDGGAGNDTIDGGSGTDTAVFSGALSDYTIERVGDEILVSWLGADGIETDILRGIEVLSFADVTLESSRFPAADAPALPESPEPEPAATTPETTDPAGPAPDGTTPTEPVPTTSAEVEAYVLEALLPGGTAETTPRWNADAPLGSAVTITWSILDAVPDYYGATAPERVGFEPMTADQREAVRAVLAHVADVTGITFEERTDGTGDVTFGLADIAGAGYAYLPSASDYAGDVWLDAAYFAREAPTPGSDTYKTILHELGHALGLEHPHEGDTLPADEMNRKYTVMSYSEHPETGGIEPSTLMLYDIAALQHLYGADTTATAGDDVYDLSNLVDTVLTIWDSGGHDVLDASASTHRVVLDLNAGAFSTSGTAYGWYPVTDNVALAYGTVIEEARGGAGNDVLVASGADNVLTGGAGADLYAFGAATGNDLITDFEDGLDRIDLSAAGVTYRDLSFVESAAGTTVQWSGSGVELAGVALSSLDETDFLFDAIA